MKHLSTLVLFFSVMSVVPAITEAADLEEIVNGVVAVHMAEKRIPGLSVAIVQDGKVIFSQGYGKASLEFGVAATPDTIYPISSVSKIFAGLLMARLSQVDKIDLDASIAEFVTDVPPDKRQITLRQLLQHTHGLKDFYRSDEYTTQTGKTIEDSNVEELIRWSLDQPPRFTPGSDWEYSLVGYIMLAQILEEVFGMPYAELLEFYVLEPIGMVGFFGGTESVIPGRNPVLYKSTDDKISTHVVDFPRMTYAAGGLNTSARQLAKLFIALSTDDFLSSDAQHVLWRNPEFANNKASHYGLGWFSYTTSENRWVVGHEGGGASWVIYYPDIDLSVIALSNLSGARADSLPYEIARQALSAGVLRAD